MNPFKLLLDHNIARIKKKHWTERARGLKGIFEPVTSLHAHNWIRREVAIRENLYQVMDQLIPNDQLYNDLDYEPKKRT